MKSTGPRRRDIAQTSASTMSPSSPIPARSTISTTPRWAAGGRPRRRTWTTSPPWDTTSRKLSPGICMCRWASSAATGAAPHPAPGCAGRPQSEWVPSGARPPMRCFWRSTGRHIAVPWPRSRTTTPGSPSATPSMSSSCPGRPPRRRSKHPGDSVGADGGDHCALPGAGRTLVSGRVR